MTAAAVPGSFGLSCQKEPNELLFILLCCFAPPATPRGRNHTESSTSKLPVSLPGQLSASSTALHFLSRSSFFSLSFMPFSALLSHISRLCFLCQHFPIYFSQSCSSCIVALVFISHISCSEGSLRTWQQAQGVRDSVPRKCIRTP